MEDERTLVPRASPGNGEQNRAGERYQWEVSAGPGLADSILHDDGRRAFTSTARPQMGLGSRRVLVQSGLYRDRSEVYSRTGAGDVAFGFAPTGRISVWTEAATAFEQGTAGAPACTFLNETAFEVYRGLWLKFSPQLRTTAGDASAGVARLLFEAYVLPRTHWNLDMSFYRDRDRSTDFVTSIFPIQLHLYL